MKGLTTIHAGSATQALTRLRFICQLAGTSSDMPMAALNSLVSEAIDIVVHCSRSDNRLRVSEVVAVEEPQGGADSTAFTTTELFSRARRDSPLAWTGNLPLRAARRLDEAGYDVRALLGETAEAAGAAAPPRRRNGRAATGTGSVRPGANGSRARAGGARTAGPT